MLTSHPAGRRAKPRAIRWGAATPKERGPIIATVSNPADRNAIGTHAGSYAIYRALAVASGSLDPDRKPDYTNTEPAAVIGPHLQWHDPARIVSLDPYGHMVGSVFAEDIAAGIDVRPSIAITKAQMNLPEIGQAMAAGRLAPDGEVLLPSGDIRVTKAAIDPVWYLPGIARRFAITETALRRGLFEQTGGMFPELVTRPDLKVFLPPVGSITVYIMGDPAALSDPARTLACRVHDECNGSDVFGSDICTCRPYLIHGIEVCVETAQKGGVGLIVYNRKEGRALGEVTKFLVYNARKRQPGGDSAAAYFERTECVAGVQDARFQEIMPDALHWLGVKRIHRLVSMSNMKYDALANQGIEIGERVSIPDDLIPADAKVEMEAKKAAGYFTTDPVPGADSLAAVKGRGLAD
ncbi:MAG: GTP cyclohydrolase II [Alphaproteobacteria bacterium]